MNGSGEGEDVSTLPNYLKQYPCPFLHGIPFFKNILAGHSPVFPVQDSSRSHSPIPFLHRVPGGRI